MFVHHLLLALQVNKVLLNTILPTLRALKKKGKSVVRKGRCGVRGTLNFKDEWRWPTGQQYLFPDRTGKSHIKKDVVCHAVQKARNSFKVMDSHKIRSHSGRHSMINMLKSENVPADAGMAFARISHKRTYDLYGQLNQLQAGQTLNSNKRLRKSLKSVYS